MHVASRTRLLVQSALAMTDAAPSIPVTRARRGAWILAVTGVALATLALVVTGLVLFDKPHFGWLVGSWFLQAITSGVMVGAVLLFIGAFQLPNRTSWRVLTLFAWAAVALLSPLFGLLFLLPWGLLLLSLPLVIAILRTLARG